MANYSYIKIKCGPQGSTKAKRIAFFEPILKRCVLRALDKRWEIALASFEDGGPTWQVTLPGTEEDTGMVGFRALGDRAGFTVALQDRAIAFRHPLTPFDRWAQGCVEEEIADHFGRGVFFDSTGRTTRVNTREYRRGKTFQEYVTRNLKRPLSPEDEKYLEKFKQQVPPGHW